MSEDKRYNGWTNYETWSVKLWIDNEESSQNYWEATAQEAFDAADADENFTKRERAALDLMERLKAEHEEALPEGLVTGFAADLLNAAMSEVNWHEIAIALLEDVEEDAEAANG